MAQGERETFKHAILIEEAHHILLRKKQEIMGEEAITDIILREVRELGEAIVLLDQHPSLISKPALGNTYTTISMNLKHRADIQMISDSLLLDMEKTRYLGKLEVGSAMVKLQGRHFEPFLVRFPHVKIQKGIINDGEVSRRMEGILETYKEEIRERKAQTAPVQAWEGISEPAAEEKNKIKEKGGPERPEDSLMEDIGKHRMSSTTERYARLGLNVYQGNRAKDSLVRKGLVQARDVKTENGMVRLLVPTEKGREGLAAAGFEVNESKRFGGLEHNFWKKKLAEYFRERGYSVTEEKKIGGGKAVDLVAVNDKERIAIEVETGKSDAFYNLTKDLKGGFDRVIVVEVKKREKDKDEP